MNVIVVVWGAVVRSCESIYSHLFCRGWGTSIERDLSLLERCPHFRGWYMYVQASMELGPEDVSLLEKCPHWARLYVWKHQHT